MSNIDLSDEEIEIVIISLFIASRGKLNDSKELDLARKICEQTGRVFESETGPRTGAIYG